MRQDKFFFIVVFVILLGMLVYKKRYTREYFNYTYPYQFIEDEMKGCDTSPKRSYHYRPDEEIFDEVY